VDHEASVKLLAAILADLPQLTGAACVGRHQLFDPVLGNGRRYRDQERVRLAKARATLRWVSRSPAVPQRDRGRRRGNHARRCDAQHHHPAC
jgi:hypothetical protein